MENIFMSLMRSSNGAINYSNIQNMRYHKIFEYNKELSRIIKEENREINKGRK